MMTKGGGGVKNKKRMLTSFMNGPNSAQSNEKEKVRSCLRKHPQIVKKGHTQIT